MFSFDWAHASGGEEFLHGQDVCVHELVTGGFLWFLVGGRKGLGRYSVCF